ncbi:MAG TPA: sugar nucleotide-binding protein [Verrucomicrobiota bacterium]|nr:sugar nucleotide-binding protein [Verrucomicrobiota bacterium]
MILLLGASGYIGQAFASELLQRHIEFVPLSRLSLDYTQLDTLFSFVRRVRPKFVINAAGYVAGPEADDSDAARAETVQANTLLPQTVARVCWLTRTPWAHVSSGSIYTGARIAENGGFRLERDLDTPETVDLFEKHPERFQGFTEDDEPNATFRNPPCNFYGGTKAFAEEVLKRFDQHYLWRPGCILDRVAHPRNFLSAVQEQSNVPDGVGAFSHRMDFVRACLDLWEAGAPYGIYNVVNPGGLTGRQVLQAIERLRRPERKLRLSTNGSARRFASASPRARCLLDTSKLLAAGVFIRPAREALEDALDNWQELPQQEDLRERLLKKKTETLKR